MQALLGLLLWGFRNVADSLFNVEVLRDARSFAFTRNPTTTPVAPGTPTPVYINNSQGNVVVHIRLQTNGLASKAYLILDTDSGKCTQANARVVLFGEAPDAQFVLQPNQILYADTTDSSGGAVSSYNVVCVPVQLQGQAILSGS